LSDRPRYSIVRGDAARHRDDVLGLSFRNLPASRRRLERHFAKYYDSNPAGAALFFLAQALGVEGFQGLVALFPTILWVGGERIRAGINGDLAVDRAHRAFGPALALERELLAALPDAGVECTYGRPNPLAEVIVKRAGFTEVGRMTRYVRVLSTRALARAHPSRPLLGRLASALRPVGDPLLSLLGPERLRWRPRSLAVVRPERFDDRFASLWEAARREHAVTIARDAQVLNWKYELDGAEPGPYSIFALAKPDGEIAAYLVYETRDDVRHVEDILFVPDRRVLDALLGEYARESRRARAIAISIFYLGPANLLTSRLRRLGFLRRTGEDGLWVHAPNGSPLRERLLDSSSWYLLAGDTDL
jgi:hypothetical protein